MKWFSSLMLSAIAAPLLCGAALVVAYVVIVGLTIPQLPVWARPGVTKWMLDVPQHSETSDNGSGSHGGSSPAGISAVKWKGYTGPGFEIHGMPFMGPIQHWSDWYDKPLLGCTFNDSHYESHTGADFPVNEGTPVHATMSGMVVWAAENGPWGSLVVIENGEYQIWLAHLSSIDVVEGEIVEYGDEIGLSGNTGNSTGAHLHYGIKHRTEAGSYMWVDPQLFFTEDEFIHYGCSD